MIFARSAAMAFNRWADARFDVLNPRTAVRRFRPVWSAVDPQYCLYWLVVSHLLLPPFYQSNLFYLSPVALLTILGYSLTKRWTAICHLILGTGLALAPIGAYLAVTSHFQLFHFCFPASSFIGWVGLTLFIRSRMKNLTKPIDCILFQQNWVNLKHCWWVDYYMSCVLSLFCFAVNC